MDGGEGGGRTHTFSEERQILSLVRLPVPPLRHGAVWDQFSMMRHPGRGAIPAGGAAKNAALRALTVRECILNFTGNAIVEMPENTRNSRTGGSLQPRPRGTRCGRLAELLHTAGVNPGKNRKLYRTNMKTRTTLVLLAALALTLMGVTWTMAQQAGTGRNASRRPQGPCDIYGAAGDPCVAAHSTTRALYASYNGPLYQVVRQSDGKTSDIGVVQPSASDAGGYANAAAQDAFCANTHCWITTVYDQSPKHNDLTQAPRGGFSGPAMGGFNNSPVADMAPITIMGHKAYGVFIEPGMGIRNDNPKGTAVDDQAEGQYWVINGHHYNSGCCFDYGNAETDSRDDDNGTMETTYYGNAGAWYHGNPPGPWVMTDQENNLVGCVNPDGADKLCRDLPNITWRFVTAMAKGEPHHWTSMGGDSQKGALSVMFNGGRVNNTYDPMRKQGAILLGNGGDNSIGSQGTFYEGAMTAAGTFPTDATDQLVQANVVAAKYDVPRLSLAPASAATAPPGLQTFAPQSSQDATLTFINTSGAPATGVKLSLTVPAGWTSVVSGASDASKTFPDAVAPGASVSATFKVTSGPSAFNGDLVGNASWTTSGRAQAEKTAEKVRNVSAVKINEFRVGDASALNTSDSFIELYNAGAGEVDLSNWSLTEHPTQQAVFSSIKIPAGTKLASHGFYLLGLATSGLAMNAHKGDTAIYVRSESGMAVGQTINIDTGSARETRKITSLGTAAAQQHDALATAAGGSDHDDSRRVDQRAGHERWGLRRRARRSRSVTARAIPRSHNPSRSTRW